MSGQLTQLQDATIAQNCKSLRMPMMAAQFRTLAEQAVREKQTHLGYLDVLLAAEIEEREKNTVGRRIKDARLPRIKTLEEFDFAQAPQIHEAASVVRPTPLLPPAARVRAMVLHAGWAKPGAAVYPYRLAQERRAEGRSDGEVRRSNGPRRLWQELVID